MVIKLYFHSLLSVNACIRKRWPFQCKVRVYIKSNVARNLLIVTVSVSHCFVFSWCLESLEDAGWRKVHPRKFIWKLQYVWH